MPHVENGAASTNATMDGGALPMAPLVQSPAPRGRGWYDSEGGGNVTVMQTNKMRKRNQNVSDIALNATDEGPTGAKLSWDSGRGWRWHRQRHHSLTEVGNKKRKKQ